MSSLSPSCWCAKAFRSDLADFEGPNWLEAADIIKHTQTCIALVRIVAGVHVLPYLHSRAIACLSLGLSWPACPLLALVCLRVPPSPLRLPPCALASHLWSCLALSCPLLPASALSCQLAALSPCPPVCRLAQVLPCIVPRCLAWSCIALRCSVLPSLAPSA